MLDEMKQAHCNIGSGFQSPPFYGIEKGYGSVSANTEISRRLVLMWYYTSSPAMVLLPHKLRCSDDARPCIMLLAGSLALVDSRVEAIFIKSDSAYRKREISSDCWIIAQRSCAE